MSVKYSNKRMCKVWMYISMSSYILNECIKYECIKYKVWMYISMSSYILNECIKYECIKYKVWMYISMSVKL